LGERINDKLSTNKDGDIVNEYIRFPEVLLIDENGESLGIKSRVEAIAIARNRNLDLLCVAPNAKPAVCKIVNYGKYRFEQQKKAKEAKKNMKIMDTKEVQLSVNIGQHDIETKLRAARKFLEGGDKVKISIRLKGRQLAFADKGIDMINSFISLCADIANVEKEPVLDGKMIMGFITPKPQKK
jgi:translation initiation factor IF-3